MTNLDRTFWTRAVVLTAMVSGGVFFTNRFAKADPGDPTRAFLTFAGTLEGTPTSPAPELTFTFRKGEATLCAPRTTPTFSDATHFTAEIPLQSTASRCPDTLFDGSDVTVEVSVAGTAIGGRQPINPVPYARYADQVGTPDCPVGYTRTTETRWVVCTRTVHLGSTDVPDEVVTVGDGRSAFWVDRYEASVHRGTTGVQLAVTSTTGGIDGASVESSGLLVNGGHDTRLAPAWALSHIGQPTANITWFQANEACRRAGKRLPTGSEWLAAAVGFIDDAGTCQISGSGARAASASNGCVSASGAHDVIGNLWEWTDDWFAGAGAADGTGRIVNNGVGVWATGEFGADRTYNVNGAASNGVAIPVGMPAAAMRGGDWSGGAAAGVTSFHLGNGPSHRSGGIGFRCVIPR